jgi:hypothetical protein
MIRPRVTRMHVSAMCLHSTTLVILPACNCIYTLQHMQLSGMCVQLQFLTLECQTLHLAVQVVRRRRSGCWCRQHQRSQDECYESCHDPNRRHRDLTNVNVRGWLPLSGPYCDAGLFRQTHHSPNWQQQRTWRVCVCLRAEQRAADTYV